MEHEIWIVFVCPLMMNLIGSFELCVANADALITVTMVNSFASQWVVRSAGILSDGTLRYSWKVRRVEILSECEQ